MVVSPRGDVTQHALRQREFLVEQRRRRRLLPALEDAAPEHAQVVEIVGQVLLVASSALCG